MIVACDVGGTRLRVALVDPDSYSPWIWSFRCLAVQPCLAACVCNLFRSFLSATGTVINFVTCPQPIGLPSGLLSLQRSLN